MNGQRSMAKALQGKPLPYGDTWLNVKPNAVIEKIFYIETHTVNQEGFAFKKAIQTNICPIKSHNQWSDGNIQRNYKTI